MRSADGVAQLGRIPMHLDHTLIGMIQQQIRRL
jgi:hypothetical protein